MNFGLKISLIVVTVLSVSACTGGNKKGPDEFGVMPTKALKYPSNMTELPEPNLAGKNLADKQPLDDVINALGGDANYQKNTQIRNSEKALLKVVGRFGITPDIRTITAIEDVSFREKNKGKVLERLISGNIYQIRYRSERLDSLLEAKRLVALGVRTPTVISK